MTGNTASVLFSTLEFPSYLLNPHDNIHTVVSCIRFHHHNHFHCSNPAQSAHSITQSSMHFKKCAYLHTSSTSLWSSHCGHSFDVILCLSSCSNCTGRGRGWPCCVPNYLRTFPKIATETSLLVRDNTRSPLSPLSPPLTHTLEMFLFLPPSMILFLLVVNFNAGLLSVSVSLHRRCHAGHSEKHRWLHQCKLHQCELVPPHFFPLFHLLGCIFPPFPWVWGVVGGLFL